MEAEGFRVCGRDQGFPIALDLRPQYVYVFVCAGRRSLDKLGMTFRVRDDPECQLRLQLTLRVAMMRLPRSAGLLGAGLRFMAAMAA